MDLVEKKYIFEYRVCTLTIIIKLTNVEATPLNVFFPSEETKLSVSLFSNQLAD